MSERVNNLKRQLEQAEQDEKNQSIERELDTMRPMIGTCIASHTFRRKHEAIQATILKIIDVEHDGSDYQPYKYVTEVIKYNSYIDTMNNNAPIRQVEQKIIRYSRSGMPNFRHSISLERYESIKNQFLIVWDKTTESITSGAIEDLQQICDGNEQDEIRMGDYITDSIPHIDLTEQPDLIKTLKYNKFPFLIGNKVLKEHSSDIIDVIIEKLIKHRSIWSHSYEYDTRHIYNLNAIKKMISE